MCCGLSFLISPTALSFFFFSFCLKKEYLLVFRLICLLLLTDASVICNWYLMNDHRHSGFILFTRNFVRICWETAARRRLCVCSAAVKKFFEWRVTRMVSKLYIFYCTQRVPLWVCMCVVYSKKVTFRNVCPLLDYIDHYRWSFFSSRYGKPSAPQCGPPIQGEDHCKYYQRHHHTLFLLQAYELLLVIGVIFYVRMNASVNISS